MKHKVTTTKTENQKSCDEPNSQLHPAIVDIRNRYGSANQFMLTFNKDIQAKVALNHERTYLGTAPSLNLVRLTYSWEVLRVWIMAQLEDINDFVSVQNKLNIQQMEHLAQIISTEYSFLKVTELHLFLHRLKAGRYGIFYGAIDPLKITQALIEFLEQRRLEISHIEHKLKQQTLDKLRLQWAQTAVTRQQYELLKNKQHETRK